MRDRHKQKFGTGRLLYLGTYPCLAGAGGIISRRKGGGERVYISGERVTNRLTGVVDKSPGMARGNRCRLTEKNNKTKKKTNVVFQIWSQVESVFSPFAKANPNFYKAHHHP